MCQFAAKLKKDWGRDVQITAPAFGNLAEEAENPVPGNLKLVFTHAIKRAWAEGEKRPRKKRASPTPLGNLFLRREGGAISGGGESNASASQEGGNGSEKNLRP